MHLRPICSPFFILFDQSIALRAPAVHGVSSYKMQSNALLRRRGDTNVSGDLATGAGTLLCSQRNSGKEVVNVGTDVLI